MNGRLEVRVTDDGVGLPAGWSLQTHGGLGLSLTRERIYGIHSHGSSHFVVSRRAEGGTEVQTSFRFVSMRQTMLAPPPESIRILVVDDEEPARQR